MSIGSRCASILWFAAFSLSCNSSLRTDERSASLVLPPEPWNIVTVAGVGNGDGGPATAALLSGPRGLFLDTANGILYIADTGGNRVRKLVHGAGGIVGAADEIITTVPGSISNDTQNNGARNVAVFGGTVYVAEFSGNQVRKIESNGTVSFITGVLGPTGVAVDSDGDLYISEFNGNRVLIVEDGVGTPSTYASPLNGPAALAFDNGGNLYVAEINTNRIRRVAPDRSMTIHAGADPANPIVGPGGLAFDSAWNLFVTETTSNRIRKLAPDGSVIDTLVPTPALSGPRGLAFDLAGNLFIGDTNNNRVRRIAAVGGVVSSANPIAISTVAGSTGYTGNDQPAVLTMLNGPVANALDPKGYLYIAEGVGHRVRKVELVTGKISLVAGNGTTVHQPDGGDAIAQGLFVPASLLLDGGALYIADTSGLRIEKVNLKTGKITTVAGNGTTTAPLIHNGLATDATINTSVGLAMKDGILYVSEASGNRIRKVQPGANEVYDGLVPKVGPCEAPTAGEVTFAGVTYCRDLGETITTFVGPADSNPEFVPVPPLNNPRGMSFDDDGNLYFGEFSGNRVRKVDASGVTVVAGTGVAGFDGDLPRPAQGALLNASCCLTYGSGALYIGDFNNHRVRRVDASGVITTVVGGGSEVLADGGPATAALLHFPTGLVEHAGNLYITQYLGGYRVRMTTVAVGLEVEPIATASGPWLTATIVLPAGRKASHIDRKSVVLQAIDPAEGLVRTSPADPTELLQTECVRASPSDDDEDRVAFDCDLDTVKAWAAGAPELVLRIQGQFHKPGQSGTVFSGDLHL